ncbi:Uridine-cytidine kinase 2, partial [Podochytrium sp. JEL0797]
MFTIAVAGGSSSGKKQVCDLIITRLKDNLVDHESKVTVIKLEDFYRQLTQEETERLEKGEYNFDHPDAVDFELLSSVLASLADKEATCMMPKWDFQSHKRIMSATELMNPDVVIVVGTLTLYNKAVRDFFNLKVFVDVDSDLRLARQVIRDTEERYQKPLESVLENYLNYVKPSFEDYILPTKKYANVVIPRGADNKIAISLMATHIADLLKGKEEQSSLERAVAQAAQLT